MDKKRNEVVQRYSAELGRLEMPAANKIRTIVMNGQLVKATEDLWFCNPLPGYNHTTYRLERIPATGDFKCNCQGYKTKERIHGRGDCSHHQALLVIFRAEQIKYEPMLF